MDYRHIRLCFFIIGIGILTPTCNNNDPEDPSTNLYEYNIPEQVQDGWSTGSATNVGLDTLVLVDMMNYINNTNNHNIHSILIF